MKLNLLATLALSVALSVLATTNGLAAPTLLEAMAPDKTGAFTVDGVAFGILHKSDQWANTMQNSVAVDSGFPQATPAGFETKGSFKTPSGTYLLNEQLKAVDGDTVTYSASLIGSPAKLTNVLCLLVDLPVGDYKAQTIMLGDQALEMPWWFKSEGLANVKHIKSIRIPLRNQGTLVITGDLSAYVQDIRAYGAEHINIQIGFDPSKGSIDSSKLELSFNRVSSTNPLAVKYNPNATKPARPKPAPPKPQKDETDPAAVAAMLPKVTPLPALRPRGEDFVDAAGKPVRFWGMNLVAFYPDHALADKTADNLASVGVNLVRPHHNLRDSRDWDPADVASLLTYDGDSRTPNLKAWDRYDYMNAVLRQKRIYLALSIHCSRSYRPNDVSIIKGTPDDEEAWGDAMDELNHWGWQKQIDPCKMLPVIDDRCFALAAEYATRMLKHVNPYTGLAYGSDPQVVSVELINEFSSEYTLVCHNTFPAYWTDKLNAKLAEYCKAKGVAPFTLYNARTPEQVRCFSDFCNDLDRSYATRMEAVIRKAGYAGPIECSNLWRGDANLRMRTQTDGVIEDHAYDDPLATQPGSKFLYSITKSAVSGKPVVIGELNQSESRQMYDQRKLSYTMMPAATAAYASLQNYAGIVWFAWAHGIFSTMPDGWGKGDSRNPAFPGIIGTLSGAGPMLDHLRTAGLIYKNRYLAPSSDPQLIAVGPTYTPNGYAQLMAGQTVLQPGWQAVHGFRKAFSAIPATQATAPWTKPLPAGPIVSDTGQIVNDPARQQVSFAAPKAEGFSGQLDGKPAAKLSVLSIGGTSGFATVMIVALDDLPLATSKRILVSRTYNDGKAESNSLAVTLNSLAKGKWSMSVTRPTPTSAVVAPSAGGAVQLPVTAWNECELSRE
ncbi:MAG TPA: hypothetical protein VGK19_05055 [Capsulimonadaceae bacterium]|jgi:hypothetical protein